MTQQTEQPQQTAEQTAQQREQAQHAKAVAFRSLHTAATPLPLANAWDVASARLAEAAGAPAVATTSAGVAWSLGAADGDALDRDRALDLIARVAAAISVPVSADIESGFADTPAGVAATVAGVLAAGAVGVNLEDGRRAPAEQAERIAAARGAADAAGIPLFLNARIDTYLFGLGAAATRLDDTVSRAKAYVAAGADGIFVPGVADPATIAALAQAVPAPLNILAGPGSPTVAELSRLGVARVSLGSSVAEAAYAVARRATEELLSAGTYTAVSDAVDYHELNTLLSP
ncbi:isocitrate lyase/phosphoenolpyruvate mutase family protein [Streptomyces sp. A3M-1-3]|uniref:isocitrate lyase/PEP mutase family protein n=1 Tax=Streptomyces sp. A3M-1-3 TaxID=2962044 RepID=UPI0020B6ED13|nr:isocitrate lyase/phosphoenolpyruvate mutase family protein [Streptomyces sp. A3M-1-3]MCP3820736.1 isocitrate lyase/phosphoenolpyruvate mutase family protein [Streptomyces sp. A3M-1-3]